MFRAKRPATSGTALGSAVSSTPRTSSRFDAGSVLTSSTRLPASARPMAVAQAAEVLPTPPLPVKKRMRVGSGIKAVMVVPIATSSATASVKMLGVGASRPAQAARSSRDGYTPLFLTSSSTFTSGNAVSPSFSRAALTAASSANAPGCAERLKRSTATPWLWSQSRSAAKRTSCGSTEGPQTPVEQHMGGSKAWTAVMVITFRISMMDDILDIRKRLSQAADKILEAAQRERLDAVADPRPVDFAAEQPGILENLEVLGHGGLRQGQLVHDGAADAGVLADEDAQDLNAHRVGDGFGEGRKRRVGLRALDGAEIAFSPRGRAACGQGFDVHRR